MIRYIKIEDSNNRDAELTFKSVRTGNTVFLAMENGEKPLSKKIGAFALMTWLCVFSGPMLLLVSLVFDGNPMPYILSAYVYIARTKLSENTNQSTQGQRTTHLRSCSNMLKPSVSPNVRRRTVNLCCIPRIFKNAANGNPMT